MGSFLNFIEKMGSNFIVAALIPSLAFVSSAMLVFSPILPNELMARIVGKDYSTIQEGLVILTFAIVLGFTLTSLNTFLLKIFEGYILVWRFPFFRKSELRSYKKMRHQIKLVQKRIRSIKDQKSQFAEKMVERLDAKLYKLEIKFHYRFPEKEEEVLPFKFGNILKAAETYPMARYSMDSVPIWTRLLHVITPSYDSKIEQTHNQLSFLVNCAVLSILFSILGIAAALYQFILAYIAAGSINLGIYFISVNLPFNDYFQRAIVYILVFIFSIFLSIIFHRASLLSVDEFGQMIRSAFDLFRFDLLKQLHLPLPNNSNNEIDTWTITTELMNVAYAMESTRPLIPQEYVHDYSKQGNPPQDNLEADSDIKRAMQSGHS